MSGEEGKFDSITEVETVSQDPFASQGLGVSRTVSPLIRLGLRKALSGQASRELRQSPGDLSGFGLDFWVGVV